MPEIPKPWVLTDLTMTALPRRSVCKISEESLQVIPEKSRGKNQKNSYWGISDRTSGEIRVKISERIPEGVLQTSQEKLHEEYLKNYSERTQWRLKLKKKTFWRNLWRNLTKKTPEGA